MEVEVVIEVPRGSFVKRRMDGGVDFRSPLPCPFNYGAVPAQVGEDGEPLDAVVLGPRLPRGHRGRWPVLGWVRFEDRGREDDKAVCGRTLRGVDRLAVVAFFRLYARGKALGNRMRGHPGRTRYVRFEPA